MQLLTARRRFEPQTLAEGMAEQRAAWSEDQFQAAVLKQVAGAGGQAYHTRLSIHSRAGQPDLFVWFEGRAERRGIAFWAELKRERGKLSPAQRDTIPSLRRAGETVFIWRPRDWEALCDVIWRASQGYPP